MEVRTSHKITYLYLIMALMIFCLHGVIIERFECSDWIVVLNHAIRVLCNASVSTFFFISAVLLYRNTERKYIDLVISKIKSLVIPYLAWSVILTIVKTLKGDYSPSDIATLTLDLLTAKNNSVLWFVRVLFTYILLYPIIRRIVMNRYICFSAVSFVFILNIVIGPTVGYSSPRYWFPIYLSGAWLGKNLWGGGSVA